jgi:hypothetical protein
MEILCSFHTLGGLGFIVYSQQHNSLNKSTWRNKVTVKQTLFCVYRPLTMNQFFNSSKKNLQMFVCLGFHLTYYNLFIAFIKKGFESSTLVEWLVPLPPSKWVLGCVIKKSKNPMVYAPPKFTSFLLASMLHWLLTSQQIVVFVTTNSFYLWLCW